MTNPIVKNTPACMLMAAVLMSVPAYASANAEANTVSDDVGTYYLQGVMEVGSALRLQPNGTFDFMLSYGAVDKAASGTWEKTRLGVTLTSISKENKRKTKLNASGAWNETAERAWLNQRHKDHRKVLQKRCSIIYPLDFSYYSGQALYNRHEISSAELIALDKKITNMQTAYARSLPEIVSLQNKTLSTKDISQQTALGEKARKLYSKNVIDRGKLVEAYDKFNYQLTFKAHSDAFSKRKYENIPKLKRHPKCINTLKTHPAANPAEWQGGKKNGVVAVMVYSGNAYNKDRTLNYVPVDLVFSNGEKKTIKLERGYATAKKPAGAKLKSVVLIGLEDKENGTKNTTIRITNDQPVQEISVSLKPPTPAFDVLRLIRADAHTLVPKHGQLKGKRYVKR